MPDPITPASIDHYAYRLTWSPEDGEYVATALEWGPSLSWLDADPLAALAGLRDLIAESVADLRADGKPIPEPIATRPFNGRVLVRMPATLHRNLVLAAAEEHVSLNQLAVTRLAGSAALTDA